MKIININNINIINHNKSFLGNIKIENGVITKIEKIENKVDPKFNYCIPSFLDQHTHGGFGINFDDPSMITQKNIEVLKEELKKEGVGQIFLTTVTQGVDSLLKIGNAISKIDSSLIKGWHIEGPFIDVAKKGAHDDNFIIDLKSEYIEKINNSFNGKKLYTIHPSDVNLKAIKKYIGDGKHWFSIGHSNTSARQANKAIEMGCCQYTHLFNGMSGFDHREPGLVASAFEKKQTKVEIIGDGVHLSQDTIRVTNEILTPKRIILISDCLWPKGLKDGIYKLGTLEIEKKKNHCYLKNQNNLAGSVMKYIDIVKIYQKTTNLDFEDLVKITSYNSAKQFKLKNVGIIKEKELANFIIVDNKLNIIEKHIY